MLFLNAQELYRFEREEKKKIDFGRSMVSGTALILNPAKRVEYRYKPLVFDNLTRWDWLGLPVVKKVSFAKLLFNRIRRAQVDRFAYAYILVVI